MEDRSPPNTLTLLVSWQEWRPSCRNCSSSSYDSLHLWPGI